MRRAARCALLLLLGANLAHAQLRTLPPDAQRAHFRYVQENVIELDGERYSLAPGARIRDQANRIIVPAALKQDALVKYRRDAGGNVREIWVLTDEEARPQE